MRRRTTLFWGPSPNKHPIRPKREDPLGGSTDKERNAKTPAIALLVEREIGPVEPLPDLLVEREVNSLMKGGVAIA